MTTENELTPEERDFLREAAVFLENPGVVIKLAGSLGARIEAGLEASRNKLPEGISKAVSRAARASIEKALDTALRTLPTTLPELPFSNARQATALSGKQHLLATALTGAVGGAFGFMSLPVELPISTALMMRSIARIAAEFGANLADPAVRLECLYIFALGSPSPVDDAADTAYYTSRLGFSQLVHAAVHGGTTPLLARLVAAIASRFEVTVTQKLLAVAVPVVGAAGGALINTAFTHHFNQAARFHFGMRRLERVHGQERIQRLYEEQVGAATGVAPTSRA